MLLASQVEIVDVRHRDGAMTQDDRIVHHVFQTGSKCECCGFAVFADIQVPDARDCLKGLFSHGRWVKVRVYTGLVEDGWFPSWTSTYKNHE